MHILFSVWTCDAKDGKDYILFHALASLATIVLLKHFNVKVALIALLIVTHLSLSYVFLSCKCSLVRLA